MSQIDQDTGKKWCLLIVDDEQVICEMLAFFFENNGFTTLQANDTHEALEIAKLQSIDLVLSDFYLPKGNGLELARQIKTSDGTRPKIIFMSGNTSEVALENLQPLGVVAVMEKPINFEFLLKEVRKVLAPT